MLVLEGAEGALPDAVLVRRLPRCADVDRLRALLDEGGEAGGLEARPVIRDERDRADLAGLASGPTRIARKRKPCKRSFPNRLRHCLIRTPVVALAVLQLPSSTGFVVDRGNRMPVGLT